jgi:hypothetical protein
LFSYWLFEGRIPISPLSSEIELFFSDFPEASTDPHICHEELKMNMRKI